MKRIIIIALLAIPFLGYGQLKQVQRGALNNSRAEHAINAGITQTNTNTAGIATNASAIAGIDEFDSTNIVNRLDTDSVRIDANELAISGLSFDTTNIVARLDTDSARIDVNEDSIANYDTRITAATSSGVDQVARDSTVANAEDIAANTTAIEDTAVYTNYVYTKAEVDALISASGNDLLDSLSVYFSFDVTGVGADTVTHDSYNGVTGVSYGGVTKGGYGIRGRCYSFDGTDDYVLMEDVAALQMFTYDYTIVMWLKCDDQSSWGTEEILSGETSSAGFSTLTSGGRVRNEKVAIGGGTNSLQGIIEGQWNMIAVVFDSDATTDNVNIYINNVLSVTTHNVDFSNGASSNVLMKYLTNYTEGYLDEFAIWKDRKLTSSEVTWLYNNGKGKSYDDLY